MSGKITGFFREYIFGLSIITFIVGLALLILSLIHYFLAEYQPEFIENLGEWNFYLVLIGLIIFAFGVYYLYSYLKNRKFVLEEFKTNKRSELLKKHSELKDTVRYMPSKYKKMLKEKEEELRIK